MRILCVDDDADTCELLTTMLAISDLEAVAVPDAAAALRLMATEQFSLYIMDSQLPDMGGLTFCQEVRKVDQLTPIVFFTGKAYQADRDAGLRAGANAYLIKPDMSEIVPTVKRLLAEARTAQSQAVSFAD